MKITIINGANLNLLGRREKEHYGESSLEDLITWVDSRKPLEVATHWLQSNHEGEIVEAIQACHEDGSDALVLNPGGYSHTSVAIHDALKLLSIPKIEVHLSHTLKREEFRHTHLTGRSCDGLMIGFGADGYLMAINWVVEKLGERNVSDN